MNISIIVLAIAIPMMVVERLYPGTARMHRKLWWFRALASISAQACIVFVAASTWDKWLSQFSVLPGHQLETICGSVIGYLTITFIFYWWHRARHEIPFLWRTLHQIHHSPARLELLTTFYKHSVEIVCNSVLSALILSALLGLTPLAASIAMTIAGVAELFYHWNIKTPRWLGYFIQRPESHRVHHQFEYHQNNYSDLPLWDILFGTFENPVHSRIACGFTHARELMLWPMLVGRNVNTSY